VPPPPGAGGSVTTRPDRWGAGRITALVFGIIVALIALALLAGGGVSLWADLAKRDSAGYITSGEHRFASPTYAIVSEKIDLRHVPSGLLDRVRVRVTPTTSSEQTFVGIGEVANVSHYLNGVRYATVTDFSGDVGTRYHVTPGGPPPGRPQAQGFWAASSAGPGERTLTWKVRPGSWVAVVMNANAQSGIVVRADLGAKVPALLWIAVGLLIAGGVFAGGSALLLRFAFRTRR